MKYSNKYMLVPYVKPIESIEETKVVSLDNEMGSILNQKNLDLSTKVKLYNKALSEFTKTYDEGSKTLTGILTNLASQNQACLEQTIKKEFSDFDSKNSKELAAIKEELEDQDEQLSNVIGNNHFKEKKAKASAKTPAKAKRKQLAKTPTTPFMTPGVEPFQKHVSFNESVMGALNLSADSPNMFDNIKTRDDRKAFKPFQSGFGLDFFKDYKNMKF